MPFRSMVQDGVLTSADMDVLQAIYDSVTADVSSVDDAMMRDIVHSLILHYQAGERDRVKLSEIAASNLRRTAG